MKEEICIHTFWGVWILQILSWNYENKEGCHLQKSMEFSYQKAVGISHHVWEYCDPPLKLKICLACLYIYKHSQTVSKLPMQEQVRNKTELHTCKTFKMCNVEYFSKLGLQWKFEIHSSRNTRLTEVEMQVQSQGIWKLTGTADQLEKIVEGPLKTLQQNKGPMSMILSILQITIYKQN